MSFERDQKTQSTRPESLSDLALEQLIKEAHVPGVAVASIIDGKPAWSTAAGFADKESKTLASADTPFWACSLSKPVFSYLILKLIEANQSGKATGVGKFKLPEGLEKFDLDTPLHLLLNYDRLEKTAEKKHKEAITARMVLSHTSGLPNKGPVKFDFPPGTGFGYSAEGFFYLQQTIEQLTGNSLEELAKEFVFDPLEMKQSHFLLDEKTSRACNYDEVGNPLPPQPPFSHAAGSPYHCQ